MDKQTIQLAKAVSRLFGWVYTLSWSLSFYPQPLLNWRRGSTVGLTVDFPAINVLGFISYSISCACFLYSPVIRAQYAARHPGSEEPTVRFNDLAFGVHAVLITALTYSQFYVSLWRLEVGPEQRISKPIAGLFWGCIFAVLCMVALVGINSPEAQQDPHGWAWIDVVYTFSWVKLAVTLCKYMPQAWFNYQRQSTSGWSIGQILFDLAGGVLSLAQLMIDASLQNDWSGLTGNPVKLGLAGISICFDFVFITQHYILYGEPELVKNGAEDESQEHLLQN